MKSGYVSLSVEGAIATVTLNRPEKMNALPPKAHYELSELFDRLCDQTDVRVVIVKGNGRAFCAGQDLKDNLTDNVLDLPSTGFAGLTWRDDYPLPLIAAVNGAAMGGGFELALACDLIIASEAAYFALPEPKVGWAALGGGVQRLPRTIGIKRAMGIILTGRLVSAQEGLELGFVNQVVPAEQLSEASLNWARQIAECAPLAIRCSKQVAYASQDQPDFTTAINPDSYSSSRAMLDSEDAIEGRRAFSEKRPPVWRSGRSTSS
ncbi:enoyl-CoA hydratase [Pseudomonas marginalis]|uniref:Enoyl-CoA hydratase n=1 Tax=Pseudomonas marginalis TaxID=298 RepID=A0A9X9BQ23_PSEMA|nr:enoyl-CoA hydratase-related protein [Pseudomonas marginalis]TWR56160.1 enoyl-CoA hydratase [Pseudomonas marginalis]SEB61962.1 crotonobetainyl-CoA hydratase [Pseudomonas marginalis]